MTTLLFLAEWALRSSVLVVSGGLLMWALRVKDPAVRLAGWVAVLCGSLAMPVVMAVAPQWTLIRTQAAPNAVAAAVEIAAPVAFEQVTAMPRVPQEKRFDPIPLAISLYGLVSLGLLLRVGIGLVVSRRLRRGRRGTGREGVWESDAVAAPVTVGILRPAIMLPEDWREWSEAKLNAVVAHERAHVRRGDPAVQLMSALHRALLWVSPLSWFLHNRIVRLAEEVSDDAAVAAIGDRAVYAEVLLEYMGRGLRAGVPMARYGRPELRIQRILEGTAVSRGVTRWSLAAMALLVCPLTYVVAAGHVAEQAAVAQVPSPRKVEPPAPAVHAMPSRAAATPAKAVSSYLTGLGNVTGSQTVLIKTRVGGMLKSVSFREGERVEAGQLLATIEAEGLESEMIRADSHREQDQVQLDALKKRGFSPNQGPGLIPQLEKQVSDDIAEIRNLKTRLAYADIRSPIGGVAGFRMVDAGNTVNEGQPIVVVTQLEPAMVVFTIPEDQLPRVRKAMLGGAAPVVEAWNRDNSVRIASGRLAAIDNQIDEQTGTIKLKGAFENKDGALLAGQFVNARLVLASGGH